MQWPLWGERGEGPKKILAALRDLNEQIEASRVRLEFGDPDHDKNGWPLAKEGEDWPRRRKPLGQLRLSGAGPDRSGGSFSPEELSRRRS